MKIDNILNKEKSPDKATIAERSASIEDIKKSQKFFDFNDLTATNINNNLLQEQETIYDYLPPTTSKLKKLLLNSSNIDNIDSHHNQNQKNSSFINNSAVTVNLNNLTPAAKDFNIVNVSNEAALPLATSNNNKNTCSNKKVNNVAKKNNAKSVNKQKLFLCSECNEYFLKLHLFNHIKSVHNKFTCLYCYGFFVDIVGLEKHLVKKHKVHNSSFIDEQSLQCFLNINSSNVTTKIYKAVCCKCGEIFTIGNDRISNHKCCENELSGLQKEEILPQNNTTTLDVAKENFYCNQAIQQWFQPSTATTLTNTENHPQTNENQPILNEEDSSQPSLNVLRNNNDSLWHEKEEENHQQQQQQHQQNEEKEKLVVPKLTLKIPKAFQNQQFDNIDSDEDSGDECDDSSDDENEVYESNNSGGQNMSKSNDHDDFSSLSDSDGAVASVVPVKKPENLPSLKLKIKNLASNNPESVLESFDFPPPPPPPPLNDEIKSTLNEEDEKEKDDNGDHPMDISNASDVDLSECPMDLEPEKVNEPQKLIIIDGVIVTPANEDVLTLDINLKESLDKIEIVKLMKICLKASFPFCLYCNHARKIVVNGRALATHFISHHRFHAMVDSITAEELHPEKIVSKFESSIDELKSSFFNLETFDNQDDEKKEGHVTISHDKLYECFQCRFQTPIHKELYLHNRKMHQKSLINCLMCKMMFYSYSELLCHICPGVANKQMFLDYKFYCCLCNLDNIPSAFRLMVHLRKKHYACDVCLEKCSDQSKLSSHVWKHKLFHLCYRCNICYRNKADIMKHLFWKHGTEGIECKKCLQKKWPHVYHFCIPPATFTCVHCEMSFSSAMALNVHTRLHEDGAKYACSEIGCEKKFVSRKLLLRHLERHQMELAAATGGGDNDGQERPEGIVMIPAEIPDGCCTRTMPVVFKRLIKKPAVRKIESEVKTEVTQDQQQQQQKKTEEKDEKNLLDLPETNLNLSESSDSDSSSDDEGEAGEKSIDALAALVEAGIEDSLMPSDSPAKEVKSLAELAKVSSLSDSDDDADDEKKSTEVKKIEETSTSENKENIKKEEASDAAAEQKIIKEEKVESKKVNDDDDDQKMMEDKLPANVILHVCQSDHDYASLYRPSSGATKDDLEDMIKTAKIEKEKKKIEKANAKAQKMKKGGTTNKNDDFSSSDTSSGSSSGSSSSSSGGSSSSSSGSSSDSSSSEASNKEVNNKTRNKKFSKKRAKKEKKTKTEDAEEQEVPKDPDDIIYESDLLTDATDTDEDFYDEHPLKLDSQMAEKRKHLLKGGVIDGIVENSRPSTPSLPPDEKIERKMKNKKRKKEHRKSMSSPRSKRPHNDDTMLMNTTNDEYNNHLRFNNPPDTPQMNKMMMMSNNYHHQPLQTSTPLSSSSAAPRIELHQANEIRQLLQSTQQQPVLPILKEQHLQQHYHHQQMDYINVSSHVPSIASSATSSRKNSDSESNLKRSQRKRIPNKFYGYTSDDESMAAQLAANIADPFKPIPPPNLTWRKEDLPTKNKSPSSTPRIAPLKLSLGGVSSDQLQQQLHTFAVEHNQETSPRMFDYNYDASNTTSNDHQTPSNIPQHQQHNLSSNVINRHVSDPSDTSDEDQLHISEPRRRKRKLPPSQANSMYAFHTLETPPTAVSQPPIPRLKLTIGSNNKIRRRNINPLKVSAAKKRKVAGTGTKKSAAASLATALTKPAITSPTFSRGVFNPYAKQYDAQPPSRILKSPAFNQGSYNNNNSQAMSSQQMLAQEKLEKKQKLEEAIMNTQQYFQRFNHTQVANSDIPQDSNQDSDGRVYCYCRRPYDDLQGMIGCDGANCQIEWFHFECVGILVPPKGNWYCPECQKEQHQQSSF